MTTFNAYAVVTPSGNLVPGSLSDKSEQSSWVGAMIALDRAVTVATMPERVRHWENVGYELKKVVCEVEP